MIDRIDDLKIYNYKSIEKLEIKPTRVNIFIGEPNAGKTNIIEALSFFSQSFSSYYREMIRFEEAADYFIDTDITKKIEILTNTKTLHIEYDNNENGALQNQFSVSYFDKKVLLGKGTLHYNGDIHFNSLQFTTNLLLYVFKPFMSFDKVNFSPFLSAPFGENIFNLIRTNVELKRIVADILKSSGYKLFTEKHTNKLLIVREEDDTLISLKYKNISSTLQRVIFMLMAIKSNQNKILLFDEPEANTYPFYTQMIAKHIAEDNSNQYFMTSHSSYLINKLIDKTPPKDISVFITKMKDYRTTVRKLTKKELEIFGNEGENAMLNLDTLY